MADEITSIGSRRQRRGNVERITHRLLFRYDVDGLGGRPSPAQIGGANVVPTPAAGLPDDLTDATFGPVVSVTEQAAFDAGTAVWEITSFDSDPTLTGPQLATRARVVYTARETAWIARYTTQYEHAGTRLNR